MEKENSGFFAIRWLKPIYIFLCFCIAFIIFKYPHLSLPYYWDEAWVYGKAVRTMADKGLSLSPNSLHFELGRGHPLLFHFLVAAFLKVAGNTVFMSHVFCLCISLFLLFTVFIISEKYIGKGAGLFTSLAIMVQPVFLAQSCLVLPEMMLTLFILLSLLFYTEKKRVLFLLLASLAMLLKESAIVLYAALSITELVLFFMKKKSSFKTLLLDLVLINSAIVPWLIFLLVQKKQMGYYFFSEHTSYISFSPSQILDKLERSFLFSFIAQGRNIIALVLLAALVFSLYKRKKESVPPPFQTQSQPGFFLTYASAFILVFIFFTCVNYFSDRYLLGVTILFTLLSSFAILHVFRKNIAKWLILLAFISAGVYNNLSYSSNSDYNLGYVNSVRAFQKTVGYIKKEFNQTDTIYCYFIMREALGHPYPGYLEKGETFPNVGGHLPGNFRYYIFSNVENEHEKKYLEENKGVHLLKRFEEKQAWVEIWKQN